MTRLSLARTFVRNFTSQIADPEKNNVFRTLEFEGHFKQYPSNEDTRIKFEQLQKEKGFFGVLSEVMTDCKLLKPSEGIEFTDENDQDLTPLEWVRQDLTAQQDAVMAFWEVINKGAEEKNLRKSRSR